MYSYTGQIALFAIHFAPKNWLQCDGAFVAVKDYAELYALIGDTYQPNNMDPTKFALPDLRDQVAIGSGTGSGGSTYRVGDSGGQNTVTLSVAQAQLPPHTHGFWVSKVLATMVQPANNLLGDGTHTDSRVKYQAAMYSAGPVDTNLALPTSSFTGGGRPHNNMQPFVGLAHHICARGLFPARS